MNASTCTGWIAQALPAERFNDLEWISPDDIWLLGQRSLYHWDGCSWRTHQPFRELHGLGVSWTDVTFAKDGRLWLRGIAMPGPQRRYGCVITRDPEHPIAYVLDGARWTSVDPGLAPPATRALAVDPHVLGSDREVTVTSGGAQELWAVVNATRTIAGVGGYGTSNDFEVWRRRGERWEAVLRPPLVQDGARGDITELDDMAVYAQAESSPSNRWLVGYRRGDVVPEIRHWDGRSWTSFADQVPRGGYRLLAVWSERAGNTWVVGSGGLVMHWDGAVWTTLPPPLFEELTGVRVTGGVLEVHSADATFRYVP